MSSWFTVLRHLLRRTEQIAPHIEGRFLPGGLGEPDQFETITIIDNEPHLINPEPVARERWQPSGITRHPKIQPLGEDLWGTTFAIEYRDAQGRVSFRRITIRELYRASEDNTLYLQCFCHERQAIRSFRFDRIVSVIDLDGEIHEPRSFFENELRVEIPTAKITPPKIRERTPPQLGNAEKAGHSQRAVARDGLRVLIALSRADSFLHQAELDVVVDYIERRAAAAGIATTAADREALWPYLSRQFPSAEIMEACLSRLEAEPPAMRKLFLHTAVALMDADGVQHPAEFDLILSWQERL